ncbi:MAG: hypothetical protein ACFFAS_02280 [Promethearchaeota archaeon]
MDQRHLGSRIVALQVREIHDNLIFEIKKLMSSCPNFEFVTIEGKYIASDLVSLANEVNALNYKISYHD